MILNHILPSILFPPHSTKESFASFKHVSVQSFTCFGFYHCHSWSVTLLSHQKHIPFVFFCNFFLFAGGVFLLHYIWPLRATIQIASHWVIWTLDLTFNCKVAQKLMGVAIQLLGNQLVITTTCSWLLNAKEISCNHQTATIFPGLKELPILLAKFNFFQ